VYASIVGEDDELAYEPADGRQLYLHVARGTVTVNEEQLQRGDSIVTDRNLKITSVSEGEFLLFDMPA
jgi:hypothetical protein